MIKALFIALLLFISGCGQFMDEEITVYPIMCDGTMKEGNLCDGKLVPLNRTTYRVSRTRQEVIYWLPDLDNVPTRLTNCAIKDKNNFRCDYEDRSESIIISEGNLIELDTEFFYVSRWKWHWLQWREWLSPTPDSFHRLQKEKN